MSQLYDLAKPFPSKFIHSNPSGGGSYVKHHVVDQRLLQVVGPFDWEKVEIIRGYVAAIPPNPDAKSARGRAGVPALENAIVGAIWRITLDIDGRRTVVEATGDCEEPHNWKTDGQRLKDAESDALKRCAMRFGCGLHLWSQEEYFLFSRLSEDEIAARLPDPPHNVDTTTGEIVGGGELAADPPQQAATPASTVRRPPNRRGREQGEEDRSQTTSTGVEADRAGGVVDSPPAHTDEQMTAAQNRTLHAALNGRGKKTDEERHRFASEVLGREVTTFAGLSKRDASRLIDACKTGVPA